MASRLISIWGVGMVFLALVGGEYYGVAGSGSTSNQRNCNFPAIFNFGDSNSDTGAGSAAFTERLFPHGQTVGKKNKRICDGRLVIDFIAEKLGLPYLNATVDSIGTSFRYGANFAVGGVKISRTDSGGAPNMNLDVQVSQFLQFKSRTIAMYKQLPNNNTSNPLSFKSILPDPEVFSKALYTIDIGHNDFNSNFESQDKDVISEGIPKTVNQFFDSVQRLLDDGAKFLWIHNTVPHGCLPCKINAECAADRNACLPALDEHGCVKKLNNLAQEFNKRLKEKVYQLRANYPDASITFVDAYSAKLLLFIKSKEFGFDAPFDYCCGQNGYGCGERKDDAGQFVFSEHGGKLLGTACNNASKFPIWDNTHFTEAANKIIAQHILNGSYSDPPVPIVEACHKS